VPKTCSACGGQFNVSSVGGGVPGGKTLEIVECPHCGAEHDRQMTSAAFIVTPIYDELQKVPKNR
jgi:transposase